MALWMRQSPHKEKTKKDTKETSAKNKNTPKQQTKRLDNLRIHQQLKITMKSIGSRTSHVYITKDLSSTGAFVICYTLNSQPFRTPSTILDCTVELHDQQTNEVTSVHFLAKIAREVDNNNNDPQLIPGFGIRIVQISPDQRYILEHYISKHGTDTSQSLEQKEFDEYEEQNQAV